MGVIFWLIIGFLIAAGADYIAAAKGRSGCGFQVFALLLPPLAFLVALALPSDPDHLNARAIKRGTKRKCPVCREVVDVEAQICPHCRSNLVPSLEQGR